MIKFKNILRLFALGTVFGLGGCATEEVFTEKPKPEEHKNLKSYFISGQNARIAAQKLGTQLGKNIPKNGNAIQSNGATVNFEEVMVVENEINDKAYTFKVDSPEENERKFQNMALIEKNNVTIAKMITYEMTQEFANDYYADLKSMKDFKGIITINTLLNGGQSCCGTPGGSVTVVIGGGSGGGEGGWGIHGSGVTNITGPTFCPSGNHFLGNPDCIYTDNTATVSNRYAAPGGGYVATIDPNDMVLCCITDIGLYFDYLTRKDCEKFKKLFDNNPNIRAELIANKAKTNMTTEQGFTKNTGSSQTVAGINGTSAGIEFATPPSGQKIEMKAHTHNSPANSTYSVFSWEDLEHVSKAMNNNQIDSNFISFLSTADGTNYAYTITDKDAFKDLYAAQQWGTPTWNQGLNESIQKAREKYYYSEPNDGTPEIIKADNTDNHADEVAFLQMLQNLNCGVTLFEVDATFTSFTKVKLDPNDSNSIKPEPCP